LKAIKKRFYLGKLTRNQEQHQNQRRELTGEQTIANVLAPVLVHNQPAALFQPLHHDTLLVLFIHPIADVLKRKDSKLDSNC